MQSIQDWEKEWEEKILTAGGISGSDYEHDKKIKELFLIRKS